MITYLIIWWLPYITILAHRKSVSSYFDRRLEYDKGKLDYEQRRLINEKKITETLDKYVEVKEKRTATEKKLERSLTEEEKWEKEYKDFSKSLTYHGFRRIIDTIYRNRGYLQTGQLDPNSIADADVRGLINFTDASRQQISLTDKGKFFTKL